MPKHYKLLVYRVVPSWSEVWKRFYRELEDQAAQILQASGFYELEDLESQIIGGQKLREHERVALEKVATALTIVANCAEGTAPGVMSAWLKAVSKKPILLRSKDLPPEALEAIAAHYQRGAEPRGTYLQDILGCRRIRYPAKRRRPRSKSIARAAQAAAIAFPRPRGRPRNLGNWLAAEYLSSVYRSLSGRHVVRHQTTTDLGSKRVVDDDGPFYRFLQLVIGPLQQHLKRRGLPAVTIETIERIATEHFR